MAHIKTRISTTQAPAAIGPYSQAVRIGDTLFTSGQVALDPATGALVAGGIREQTTRVFENLAAVLEEAGLDMSACRQDHRLPQEHGRLRRHERGLRPLPRARRRSVVPPARSTVEVARLPKDALVEIEMIAIWP